MSLSNEPRAVAETRFRWKRFWFGMDVLLFAWLMTLFWLAAQGDLRWWSRGLTICMLYFVVRCAVLAFEHARTWRLWALFDFAVVAIALVLVFLSDVGDLSEFWGLGLFIAFLVFSIWRSRRWPRRL